MVKYKLIINIMLTLMMLISSAFAYSPQYVNDNQTNKLHWNIKKIPIYVSNSFFETNSNIKAQSEVLKSIENSLKSWENVANIEFELKFTNSESISNKSSGGDNKSIITIAQTSENLLMFGDKIDETSALTRLFYNERGEIIEADIVLNPIQLFSTDGTFGSFDLEATLTHEIGHLLGLDHSQILGATMHSHQGKNGIYNLNGFNSRTLSADDKAGAISLYGKSLKEENCCGKVSGTISQQDNKTTERFDIWFEEIETGRIIAGTTTNKKGEYQIDGLPQSIYQVFAQDQSDKNSTVLLGEIEIDDNSEFIFDKKISLEAIDFNLTYLGFNGQLANLAVPVVSGKTYTIYFAGKDINPNEIDVAFSTKNITVFEKSLVKHNYGLDLDVYSFEMEVAENTLVGDYSFYIKKKNGSLLYFVGGVTVDDISTY